MALEYESFEVQGKSKGNVNVSFVQHEPENLRDDMKDTLTSQGIDDSVLRSIQSVVILMELYFCSSSQKVQDKS